MPLVLFAVSRYLLDFSFSLPEQKTFLVKIINSWNFAGVFRARRVAGESPI